MSNPRGIIRHMIYGVETGLNIIAMTDGDFNDFDHTFYSVEWFDQDKIFHSKAIRFQSFPIPENGINGLTNEVMIAIVIDRLEAFQKGQHACEHNRMAIERLSEGLHWLKERTTDRLIRGVEGTEEQ